MKEKQAVIVPNSNRIEWIDATKALAIVLMIIGHTVEFGTFTRNLIFSFHMPVFVLLSGYTYKVRKDKSKLIEATIKDVKRLLGPVILTFIIEITLRFLTGNVYTIQAFIEMLKVRITALFWASGIAIYDSAALGSIWFLISLFWVRFIVRLITTFLSYHVSILVMLGLSVVGVLTSRVCYLPQNFDVVFAMLFFFAVGMLWKNYYETIQKYSLFLTIGSICFLSVCLYKGIYIELASRSYPYGLVCFLEAVAGSYLCVQAATFLSKYKTVNRSLQIIGKETLLILCIHYLDKFFKPLWLTDNIVLSCGLRMLFDLGVFAIIFILKNIWKSKEAKYEK